MKTFQTMATEIDGYIGELNSLPLNELSGTGVNAKVSDFLTKLQSIHSNLIVLSNIKEAAEILSEVLEILAELTYEDVGRIKRRIHEVEDLSPASSKISRELIRYVNTVNYGDMSNFEENLRRIQIIMRQYQFEQLAIMDKKEAYITRVTRSLTTG